MTRRQGNECHAIRSLAVFRIYVDSSLPAPRPPPAEACHAAATRRTRREPLSSENLKRGSSACQTSAYSRTRPSTQSTFPFVDPRAARQSLGGPHPQGGPEVHASILAADVGSDPVTGTSLAQFASTLPQVEIVDHRLLRPGRSAQIVIVDCRDPTQDTHGRAKLASELVQLALVAESSLDRRTVFSNGYSDYLLWPPMEPGVLSRLAACVAGIARRAAPPFFSADPLVQGLCDLLAQRLDQQITLSKLALTVGTNQTTLVNRFEASFNCGPMTWLRRYRMSLAAERMDAGTKASHRSQRPWGIATISQQRSRRFIASRRYAIAKMVAGRESLPDAKVEPETNQYTATDARKCSRTRVGAQFGHLTALTSTLRTP